MRPQDQHGAGGEQHPKHPLGHAAGFIPHYRQGLDFMFPISTGSTRRDGKTRTFPPMHGAQVTLGQSIVTNPLPCPPQLISSLCSKRERVEPPLKKCLSLKKNSLNKWQQIPMQSCTMDTSVCPGEGETGPSMPK